MQGSAFRDHQATDAKGTHRNGSRRSPEAWGCASEGNLRSDCPWSAGRQRDLCRGLAQLAWPRVYHLPCIKRPAHLREPSMQNGRRLSRAVCARSERQPLPFTEEGAAVVWSAQSSRQPLQRKSGTWQAPVPFPWRAVDRAEDLSRPCAHCWGTASAVEEASWV